METSQKGKVLGRGDIKASGTKASSFFENLKIRGQNMARLLRAVGKLQ